MTLLIVGFVVSLSVFVFSFAIAKASHNYTSRVKLAHDLKNSGWTLYVAMKNCVFCQVQRMLFGPGIFEMLDVVDCDASDEMRERCKQHPVCSQGTPCWYNKDSKASLLGLQRDFQRLEQAVRDKK